ncbi:MAG: Flp pilus assembly protein CpaB [Pseudomonadota bacterium]
MRTMQMAVFGVALLSGAGVALMLATGGDDAPQQVIVEAAPQIETEEVLVAAGNIGVGRALTPMNLQWKEWPRDAASSFITRSASPDAIEAMERAIVRTPFYAGEPIREQKVVRADGSGYMSAILPRGMLAVAIEIDSTRSAGGFVLPNDRVDIILTQSSDSDDGGPDYVSRTILENVRVLAIDQTVEDSGDGDKVVIGETATVELNRPQAETLSSATEIGQLQLALRSLADSSGPLGDGPRLATGSSDTITMVRFGQAQTVSARSPRRITPAASPAATPRAAEPAGDVEAYNVESHSAMPEMDDAR